MFIESKLESVQWNTEVQEMCVQIFVSVFLFRGMRKKYIGLVNSCNIVIFLIIM